MVRKNLKRRFPLFLFFGVAAFSFAQEKTTDTSSVRKDFNLPNPIRYEAFYDVASGNYFLYPKIGSITTGTPIVMNTKEYQNYMMSHHLSSYYKQKSNDNDLLHRNDNKDDEKKGLLPSIQIKNNLFEIRLSNLLNENNDMFPKE